MARGTNGSQNQWHVALCTQDHQIRPIKTMKDISLSRISPATANRLQRWITQLSLCALLLAGASVHAETYYKWKHDNGSWEYGAHPPADKHAIEIKTTATKAMQVNAGASGNDGAEPPSTAQSTLEMEFAEKRKASKKKNADRQGFLPLPPPPCLLIQ